MSRAAMKFTPLLHCYGPRMVPVSRAETAQALRLYRKQRRPIGRYRSGAGASWAIFHHGESVPAYIIQTKE